MDSTLLFALDVENKKILVSQSKKNSTKIDSVDEITQQQAPLLFKAVEILTTLADATELDTNAFKATNKVCQLLYSKYKAK